MAAGWRRIEDGIRGAAIMTSTHRTSVAIGVDDETIARCRMCDNSFSVFFLVSFAFSVVEFYFKPLNTIAS
jgi:hypothetical protein